MFNQKHEKITFKLRISDTLIGQICSSFIYSEQFVPFFQVADVRFYSQIDIITLNVLS